MTHLNRRRDHYRKERLDAFLWGLLIGLIFATILMFASLWAVSDASGAPTLDARASTTRPAWPPPGYPPHYRTWLRIGMCEQPKRGISWHDIDTDRERVRAIAWRQEYNWGFPGGLGLTRLNWTTFRPPSAKHIEYMSRASIAQQLWSAERLWRWAERTYPGAGFTAWECSRIIGWASSDPDDALR